MFPCGGDGGHLGRPIVKSHPTAVGHPNVAARVSLGPFLDLAVDKDAAYSIGTGDRAVAGSVDTSSDLTDLGMTR